MSVPPPAMQTTPPRESGPGKAQVLLFPDILREIFNHLQPGRYIPDEKGHSQLAIGRYTPKEDKTAAKRRSECRKALFMSAITCRALSDLALDVLWRALDDIRPLLRLLPTYKRPLPVIVSVVRSLVRSFVGPQTDIGILQVLQPNITPATWAKFESYASRVREIGYSTSIKEVHPSVWTFLTVKCEGSTLLPHLCRLEARGLSPDDLSPLFLLLSPSLRSLSLSFGRKSGEDVAAPEVIIITLQHATQVAPRVESFHISSHNRFSRNHLSKLQQFSKLTELSLGATFVFDETMVRQLSTTTSLRSLSIAIGHIQSSSLQDLADNFQSLNRLALRGDLTDLANFILAFSLPHLDALTLQANDCNKPQTFRPQFASICQHLAPSTSLTRIDLEFRSGMIVQRQETLLQYLEPLLSFPGMERCNLIFYNTAPSVCDEDLIRLGDAWPNLQYLNFKEFTTDNERYGQYSKYGHLWCNAPDIQHPTVLGLTELARRCPTLRYIHLVTADVSALPSVDAVSHLDHPMREMSFDHVHNAASSGQTRCAVAEVLDAAFPKLSISLSGGHRLLIGRPETGHQWRRILMLVRIMRRRRKHPDSETGDGAMQSLADLNVDGEVTESDPESDESVQDGAVDLDLEDSEDSEDTHDSSAESDQSEEVRSLYATVERTSSCLLIPLHSDGFR